jgi:hypothetical protein
LESQTQDSDFPDDEEYSTEADCNDEPRMSVSSFIGNCNDEPRMSVSSFIGNCNDGPRMSVSSLVVEESSNSGVDATTTRELSQEFQHIVFGEPDSGF